MYRISRLNRMRARLTLERDSQVCFFGDLHGSAHSLIRDLKKLKELGYLDNQFKITKKNFHIIFLGDYIDRGIYGVEVVYTLCRLKLANSSQVILVRGNHEDYILAPDFRKKHTKEEQKDNAPSFIDELYLKFDLTQKDEIALFRFYELLPVVCYVGTSSDMLHCCHGGLGAGIQSKTIAHRAQRNHSSSLSKNFKERRITTLFLAQSKIRSNSALILTHSVAISETLSLRPLSTPLKGLSIPHT